MDKTLQRSIDDAAQQVAAAESVAALTGAGVSAESGIPTFRDCGGLWEDFRVQDVATPEAFQRNPRLVWKFYNARRTNLADVRPNPAHFALAEWATLVSDFHVITQNVDRLHHAAGSRHVIELHGDLWSVRCDRCCEVFDRTRESLAEMPECDRCGRLVRPNVVWFGEELATDVWAAASAAARRCECMLVVGTSAVVHPAAGLASMARDAGADVVEINLEETPARSIANLSLYGPAGVLLPQLVARVRAIRFGDAS